MTIAPVSHSNRAAAACFSAWVACGAGLHAVEMRPKQRGVSGPMLRSQAPGNWWKSGDAPAMLGDGHACSPAL